MLSDDIEDILAEAEDLDVYISMTDSGSYELSASFEHGEKSAEMMLSRVSSTEELGQFYKKYFQGRNTSQEITVYGNSRHLERQVAERETWSLVEEEEWALDILEALNSNMSQEKFYEDLISHTSASALASISLSQSYGEKRPESYDFYLQIIEDLDKQQKRGIRGRIKKRAKDKAKNEVKTAVNSAVEEAEKEFRKLEREGKIDEFKEKAKEEAQERGKKAAKSALDASKQKTKEKAWGGFQDLKETAVQASRNVAYSRPKKQKNSSELPKPTLRIEEDGVVYEYYGEVDFGVFTED